MSDRRASALSSALIVGSFFISGYWFEPGPEILGFYAAVGCILLDIVRRDYR